MTRRDRIFYIGGRAKRLTPAMAARAWMLLAQRMVDLGEKDIPKFKDLIDAIEASREIAWHER